MMRQVLGTANPLTLAVSGTGTAGMEAALSNLLEPGDAILIGANGYFSERLAEISSRCRARVARLEVPWGQAVGAADLAPTLARERPKVVAIVHGETSTGVLQPLEEISTLTHEAGALLLVDAVTSMGGAPIDMDRMDVDALYGATQKCLGGPPGLAPISFGRRAVEALRQRRSPVQSFYLDLTILERYWGGEMVYHHTISMPLVYALREALRQALEEGMEERYERHRRVAAALRAGLEALGLPSLTDPACQASMLTAVGVPEGIDEAAIRGRLLREEGIEIGAGLGAWRGKAWRIGMMGESCSLGNALTLLAALQRLLGEGGGQAIRAGAAVAAAAATYAAWDGRLPAAAARR